MTPTKQAQRRLGEIEVDDKELLAALDGLTELEQELHPLLEARANMTRGINTQIKQVREDREEADLKAVVAEHEAKLLETHKKKLFDGFQFRVGGYVIEVKEVVTMEKVEHGMGFKLKRPLLVSDEEAEEDDDDD